jgi:hypothetical protein
MIMLILAGVVAFWRSVPILVKPETLIPWHRDMLRLVWRWRCRSEARAKPRPVGRDDVSHPAHGRGEPSVGRSCRLTFLREG